MRNRHFPRLCRSCDVPMARQDDACWSCGAAWEDPAEHDARRAVDAGHAARAPGGDRPQIAVETIAPVEVELVPAIG